MRKILPGLLPVLSVLALVLCGLKSGGSTPKRHAPRIEQAHRPGSVEIQMRNVDFRIAKGIVLEVAAMRGRLRRTNPAIPVTFDDSNSFTVEIDSGQVAISPSSLTELMNSYVFGYNHAPITNIRVSIENGRLIQKGTIHKGVELPFEIEGDLSATNDGNIRLHAAKIKSAHVPIKGLLHLFGEDLAGLIKQNAAKGVRLEGDDLILTPRTLTPPPHLEGHVARVEITDGKIVQFFDSGAHSASLNPPFHSEAYIYHRGGVLRFGKLTMNDADLEIVGDRPGRFDFFQREYQKQLVAGYSKNTPANGLVAHMVDYSHFESGTGGAGGTAR